MDEPRRPAPGRTHRIAAAFDSEADAESALRELESLAHEVHVVVHLPGCHEVDEAERDLARTMLVCILVATPLTVLALFGIGLAFNSTLGDLSIYGVIAVAVGPGGIFGILLGGIIGLALSQHELDEAQARSHGPDHGLAHPEEEVLVAHVDRGALHNPNLRRVEFDGRPTRAIVEDLETQVRQVFAEHHGHLIDA